MEFNIMIQNYGQAAGIVAVTAEILTESGHKVYVHQSPECPYPVTENKNVRLLSCEMHEAAYKYGPFKAVIFDVPAINEGLMLDRILLESDENDLGELRAIESITKTVNNLSSGIKDFLQNIRKIIVSMLLQGGSQFWILGLDDSFQYSVEMPIAPISTHARLSAFKSLTKECARQGFQFNAMIFQPPAEMLAPKEIKTARKNLQVYGLRYKLLKLHSISQMLVNYVQMPVLPFNGSVVSLGMGVIDYGS